MINIFIICIIFVLLFLLLDKLKNDEIIKNENFIKYQNIFIKYLMKIKSYDDISELLNNNSKDLFNDSSAGIIKDYNNFIYFYDNFLTNDECEYFINIDKNKYNDSTLFGPNNNHIDKKIRSSQVIHFGRKYNKLIEHIENKIALLLNIRVEQIEPIQLTKYEKGQDS